MTKYLLGTTALVIVMGVVGACPVVANEKIKLGLGGYWKAFIVAGSEGDRNSAAANQRSHGIGHESEIYFKGKTVLDNGIEFGVKVELEAETSTDQIDESMIYMSGEFGRIEFGSDDPAPNLMFHGPQGPIAGQDGVLDASIVNATLGDAGAPDPAVGISGDADKITYFTPRINGLQVGVTYSPDAGSEDDAAALSTDSDAGEQSETIEVGVNYTGNFDGGEFAISGGYATAHLEVPTAGSEDQQQYGFGGEVSISNFTIGAAYKKDNQGTSAANTDRSDWGVSASYTLGAITLGAEYATVSVEAGTGLGDDETTGVSMGVKYALGPGITLTGGINIWDASDNANVAANENESTIGMIGTVIKF